MLIVTSIYCAESEHKQSGMEKVDEMSADDLEMHRAQAAERLPGNDPVLPGSRLKLGSAREDCKMLPVSVGNGSSGYSGRYQRSDFQSLPWIAGRAQPYAQDSNPVRHS